MNITLRSYSGTDSSKDTSTSYSSICEYGLPLNITKRLIPFWDFLKSGNMACILWILIFFSSSSFNRFCFSSISIFLFSWQFYHTLLYTSCLTLNLYALKSALNFCSCFGVSFLPWSLLVWFSLYISYFSSEIFLIQPPYLSLNYIIRYNNSVSECVGCLGNSSSDSES